MPVKITTQKRNELRTLLYKRDGTRCHYCGIEEKDFITTWGNIFYGGKTRGNSLEIDHKNNELGNSEDNLVLACALCNMSKSNIISYDEFLEIGKVIKKIWQKRLTK
jgi:hypothetical protein